MRRLALVIGGALLVAATWTAADELKEGDLATVNKDKAEIKVGQRVVAYLMRGQRVKVNFVFGGGWARIYYTLGGQTKLGDISVKDLDPPARTGEKAVSRNPFVADDVVVVIAKEAKLKLGDDTLGTVPEGTRLTVKKINGDWVGVMADVKGKQTFGWLHARDVDYPTMREKGAEKAAEKKEAPGDKGAKQ